MQEFTRRNRAVDSQCDQRCTTATWCFPLTPHCSRKHDAEVQLYAFYVLALDGEDLRRLPLSMRKTNLDRLSAHRPEGIFVAPFEQGEIGPDLFRAACKMGLEGLVSKRRDRAYRGGRCTHWIKVKNPASLAMNRAAEIDWSR
jgi:bifunctional non-homologous end joining protein LigD